MLCAIYHAALVRDALIKREASSTDVPPAEGLLEPTDTDSQAALKLILADTGARAERDFEVFREALEAREWRTDELCYADHGHRVTWAHDG